MLQVCLFYTETHLFISIRLDLPMLWTYYIQLVHIIVSRTVSIPPIALSYLNIISAHLPFPHYSIVIKRPVLFVCGPYHYSDLKEHPLTQSIASEPAFLRFVEEFIPELHGDFVIAPREKLFSEPAFEIMSMYFLWHIRQITCI